MKLDFETIKNITVGAVEIWQENDAIRFLKCSKNQLNEWQNISLELYRNARASTGIRLDFFTNSPFVTVYPVEGTKFEIKINGILTEVAHVDYSEQNPFFTINLDNGCELNHVVVFFPSHFESGGIKSVEVADCAIVKRNKFDNRFLFMGDSITQGYNAKYDCLSYAFLVSEYFNAESVIQGVGGSCFSPATVMDINFKPNVVFVAYGTNDFGCLPTLENLKINCFEYLTKVKKFYSDAKIIVITPIWRMDEHQEKPMGNFKQCKNVIKQVALDLGLIAVDGETMVYKNPDFMKDTVHPNDLGFCIYANNLIKQIEKII